MLSEQHRSSNLDPLQHNDHFRKSNPKVVRACFRFEGEHRALICVGQGDGLTRASLQQRYLDVNETSCGTDLAHQAPPGR